MIDGYASLSRHPKDRHHRVAPKNCKQSNRSDFGNDDSASISSASVAEEDKAYSSPEMNGFILSTPSTQAYLEKTRLRGLPLIPFAYTSSEMVKKLSEKTKQMCRESSNSIEVQSSNISDTTTKDSEKLDNNSIRKLALSEDPLHEKCPMKNNNNNITKSYHITLDHLDLEECLNFQPPEHRPLENLLGIAQQELLQQNEQTMFDLYGNEDLLTFSSSVGSVGSLPLNYIIGDQLISNNSKNVVKRSQNELISKSASEIGSCIDSAHIYMDFEDKSKPIFAPKGLSYERL